MSKIVKLKSTGTGYSLMVGGETVKTGLPSVSLALKWLRNNYGRKFQESLVHYTSSDGSRKLGSKNPSTKYYVIVTNVKTGREDKNWWPYPTLAAAQKQIDSMDHVEMQRRGLSARIESSAKPTKRRNIAMGITQGTGKTRRFFPIRASADYDPTLLSGSEGKRARSEKRSTAKKRSGLKAKGKKAIKTKSTVKTKLATKRRKAKKAVGLFGARALKKALPTSRRNPGLQFKSGLTLRSNTPHLSNEVYFAGKKIGEIYLVGRPGVSGVGDRWEAFDLSGNSHGRSYTDKWEAARGLKRGTSSYSNPKHSTRKKAKRSIPAAFKAQAQRAKAMTPAQRAAWAKKMQAARKAKARLKNR